MRSLAVSHSPSWLSRSQADIILDAADPSRSLNQVPLSPSFVSPRPAPKAPTFKNTTFKNFQSVFHRKPPRSPSESATSFHSSDSLGNSLDIHTHHPYATMPPPPLPVVSNHDILEDEQECPVCLEPLSFSFRLPGEKPHVVPECGHSLHEVISLIYKISPPLISSSLQQACFTAVYGPPPSQSKSAVPRKSNLGVCGVCRRPMKVGEGDNSKINSPSISPSSTPRFSSSPHRTGRPHRYGRPPYSCSLSRPRYIKLTTSPRSGAKHDHSLQSHGGRPNRSCPLCKIHPQ